MNKQITLEEGQLAIVFVDRGEDGFSLIPYHNVDIGRAKVDQDYAKSFTYLYMLQRGMIDMAVSNADLLIDEGSDLTQEEGGMSINIPGEISNDNATIH